MSSTAAEGDALRKAANERLHDAVAKGDVSAAKTAVAAGADVNALVQDTAQVPQTALQRAINSEVPLYDGSRLLLVKCLVSECKADVNRRDAHGTTPLLSAVGMLVHEHDRLQAIPEKKRKGQHWLEFLMAEQIVRFLYEHNADPDAADSVFGRTPRAFAAEQDLADIQDMFSVPPAHAAARARAVRAEKAADASAARASERALMR
eukprot:TRINITY_DN19483_c0_g1_i1.p1 TRINITY_DN19483_c0_g1~~TRINITY_DN19483_c0_g1_i1.p1  ORF type:complete len:206 (-),score=68.79 TRINITY_DN19483_c0_g1_i1:610-1227(-)